MAARRHQGRSQRRHRAVGAAAAALAVGITTAGAAPCAFAQINESNWGLVTAPTFGTQETTPGYRTTDGALYAGTELFAGPNKFGSYYAGVVPNGKFVKPAGTSIQVGMNPLGSVLTPDGKFLITSNDDERDAGTTYKSLQNSINQGSYSISVIDTATFKVVAQFNTGTPKLFIGLQVKSNGDGSYTLYASGGADQKVYLFRIASTGAISAGSPASITISPALPQDQGYVSNYTQATGAVTHSPQGDVPIGASGGPNPGLQSGPTGVGSSAKITFPAGSALSADGRYLYVACNGDNSVVIIDTTTNTVLPNRIAVGFFPYTVALAQGGSKVLVSNWGVEEYKFAHPTYDGTGKLTSLTSTGNLSAGFFVPATERSGANPRSSSISVIGVTGGDATTATLQGAIYQGQPSGLDDLYHVGDTHPSALAVVHSGAGDYLYVTKTNSDSIGIVAVANNRSMGDFDLSQSTGLGFTTADGVRIHGGYPNAIAVSPNNRRVYVAEAGTNTVAVLDTTVPTRPRLLGRIPTGWYPSALSVSPDGSTLYVINAKGIGEDINPNTNGNPTATGVASFADSNFIYGSAQKIDLTTATLDNGAALGNVFAVQSASDPQYQNTSVVPIGGAVGSSKIRTVIFIEHENKTFDSFLGNLNGHFQNFASMTFNNADGSLISGSLAAKQYTGVALNYQALANAFAAGVNYYSDSEESDAGHQFCASGTATDYTEKTLLVKGGRGLLVNKNFEPEDYPEAGYIFNNAARHGISFKDYGELIRIDGTDTGVSVPTTINDPASGNAGTPSVTAANDVVQPITTNNVGDTTSPVSPGLGQSYFLNLPILKVLGDNNASGEPHIDRNYPGYNFNISDQRRAQEFIKDFDRMVAAGTLPRFIYLYQPNDHTGSVQAATKPTPIQLVADGDVGLGMVISHIMNSPAYYSDPTKGGDGSGAAIFVTFDDAQSSLDHIHPHRTPLLVVSPYAKPGYVGKKHYVTASIVKTEELMLGLPPLNYGDLTATDLRDLFQPTYNGITAANIGFTRTALNYKPSPEGRKVWDLVAMLDTATPDKDSHRLGALGRLSIAADELHFAAEKKHTLDTPAYKSAQEELYATAVKLVSGPKPSDGDGDDK